MVYSLCVYMWMKALRIGLSVILLMLAACKPRDLAPQTDTVEVDSPVSTRMVVSTPQVTLSRTPDPEGENIASLGAEEAGQLDSTPTWTPVITSTVALSSTPTVALNVTITPTVPITSTPSVSETITTSTTSVLTETLVYTDVQVISSRTIHQIAWDRDGDVFGVATSVGLFLYVADTLEVTRTLNVDESVLSVAFSPTGEMVVTGGLNGSMQWWEADTGKFTTAFKGHRLGITDLAFTSGNQYFVTGSDDGTVRLWVPADLLNPDINDPVPVNTWRLIDRVTSVDLNQQAQMVAAGSYQTVSVWDIGTGELVQTLEEFMGRISGLTMSPDGRYLAVADSSNHLRVWRTGDWIPTHDIQITQIDLITAIGFSHDGMLVAMGGENGAVVVWDMGANTLYEPGKRYSSGVSAVAFHPDDRILVSIFQDGLLRIWSLQP